ncbi:citrate synthase family protein [Anaerolineales bacterium]
MVKNRYLTAKEAASALDISLPTLYAYVSRGLIRSEASTEGQRVKRYYAEDIEKLIARKEGRRNPEKLARDALHWGSPILESAITLIAEGKFYYRGLEVSELALNYLAEDIATLIWSGSFDKSEQLFNPESFISAQKYETMLVHIAVDGIDLSPIASLEVMLAVAAMDDVSAYDLRPQTVMQTGARILRLMTSVMAGDVPENISLAEMLARGWCPDKAYGAELLNIALILCADHELNASSFTARVVASTGSTPYGVVQAGLAALQGVKHGGHTERVEALWDEIGSPERAGVTLSGRLRRGDQIPGFGHILYTEDPRAKFLLNYLFERFPEHPVLEMAEAIMKGAEQTIGEYPSIDFALVTLSKVLALPEHSAMALFALGRTIGWIGQAIEQYQTNRLIRPRARYIGEQPKS